MEGAWVSDLGSSQVQPTLGPTPAPPLVSSMALCSHARLLALVFTSVQGDSSQHTQKWKKE